MKGLLFSAEMARANVAGRKTETRRLAGLGVVNAEPGRWVIVQQTATTWQAYQRLLIAPPDSITLKPRFTAGEVFYQREACCAASPWKSGLMMPAWASRFFGRITAVRCERLSAITEGGARAEGFERTLGTVDRAGMTELSAKEAYLAGFARINPKAPPDPWVWVYQYRRISREEAFA